MLKATHLGVTIKEIQAGYLVSPYSKDIYLYLTKNKLPNTNTAIQEVETLAERYILLDSLLFKVITTLEKKQHYWLYQRYAQIRLLHSIIQVYLQDIKES